MRRSWNFRRSDWSDLYVHWKWNIENETCAEQRKYGYNEKELIEAKLYSLQKLWYILRKTLDELIDWYRQEPKLLRATGIGRSADFGNFLPCFFGAAPSMPRSGQACPASSCAAGSLLYISLLLFIKAWVALFMEGSSAKLTYVWAEAFEYKFIKTDDEISKEMNGQQRLWVQYGAATCTMTYAKSAASCAISRSYQIHRW